VDHPLWRRGDVASGTTTRLEELADRNLVIETVVENGAAKTELLARLDGIVFDRNAGLASNTSSIPTMRLGVATTRPVRVIGVHFFDPVRVLSLVEIVPRPPNRSRDCGNGREVRGLGGKARQLVSRPCRIRGERNVDSVRTVDSPHGGSAGFASAADIDAGLVRGADHPQGPLAVADLIGLDTTMAVAESLYTEFKKSLYALHRCSSAWSTPDCWAACPVEP
jgi:3-hydroxybutyryl-CoA dehydrogenase